MQKSSPDWNSAKQLYRAGQLSIRMIAAQVDVSEGAIRKRAKKEGWQRDLKEKVRQAVRNALVRGESAGPTRAREMRAENEIVEQAAASAVEVVREHRHDLRRLQGLMLKLYGHLESAVDNRDELIETAEQQATEGDPRSAQRRLAEFKRAISLPGHITALRELSMTVKAFQQLERAAWSLDDAPPPEKTYEQRLRELVDGSPVVYKDQQRQHWQSGN